MASASISIVARCHAASPAVRNRVSTHNRSTISASTRPSRASSVLARSAKKGHEEKAKEFAFREDHAGECDLSDARDVSSQHSASLPVPYFLVLCSTRDVLRHHAILDVFLTKLVTFALQALEACRGLEGQALEDCWASFNCNVDKVTDHYAKVAGVDVPGKPDKESKSTESDKK